MDSGVNRLDKGRPAKLFGGENLAEIRPKRKLCYYFRCAAAARDNRQFAGIFFVSRFAEIDR